MQRFEFSDDKSNKFWQVAQHGCELHIQWGKIGTSGQSQIKAFDTEAKAEAAKARLIAEKTGKGYVAAGGSDLPATPITAPTKVARPAAAAAKAADASAPAAPALSTAETAADAAQLTSEAAKADVALVADEGACTDAHAGEAPAAPAEGGAGSSVLDAKPDAINAWLAARRAMPSVDMQALAAWRQLLALAETEPEVWNSPEPSVLKKRLGIDADVASVVWQWRSTLLASAEWAALWRQDADMAQLDAPMAAVLDAAWQPLRDGEPARAAQPSLTIAGAEHQGKPTRHGVVSLCDFRAARFGQFMPAVPLGPVFSPVTGDSARTAWRALQAQWPLTSLPAPEHSNQGFPQDVVQLQDGIAQAHSALSSAEPPPVGHAGWPMLLCVAFCLGEGDQGFDSFTTPEMRAEWKARLPGIVGGQLWHVLRHTHTLAQRWQLLVESLGLDAGWMRHTKGTPMYARVGVALGRRSLMRHPMLARMRQDLLAASDAERAECLALFQQAHLPSNLWPVLAWVWRDVADVSDWCIARCKQRRRPGAHDTSMWLVPLLREPAQLAELALDARDDIPEALADAMLQRLGVAALPVFLPRMSHHDAPLEALTRLNHPDAVLMLMRHINPSDKAHAMLLRRATRRWPLAALCAATQLAQGQGAQATFCMGLVRQLLGEVGPALPLLQPWLPTVAWRWLSQLAGASQAVEEADAATLAAQVPVLISQPWLQKRKAGAEPVVSCLVAPDVPNALDMWPETESQVLLDEWRMEFRKNRSSHHIASDLAIWRRRERSAHISAPLDQWVQFMDAGDGEALFNSWFSELARIRMATHDNQTEIESTRYGVSWDGVIRTTMQVELAEIESIRMAVLPQAAGVAFFERVADEMVVMCPELLLAQWGAAALPGMVKLAARRPADVAKFSHRMGSTSLAMWAAKLAFATKHAKPRAQGQRWLKAWPRHAAAGLLLPAVQGTPDEQETAGKALRWLHARGHAEALAEVAAQFGGGDGVAALQAVLARDPLDLFPAKYAKTLPEFWQPGTWSRPQLRSGAHLPLAALTPLGQMLSFARPDGVYAGLEQVRAACTPESLGAFAWDLFSAWLAAGAAGKDNWAFTALGVFGDEVCVQRLRPLMKSWPEEGASARASLGLQVLAEIGSTAALRLIADVADRDKPKGLVARAQALLTEVAEARGMTLEDLQDRLVPTMGLDERGQTVLDYGPRQFLLTLDENLKPFLRKLENGKPGARLKSQPAKNASDDPAMATQAIERFKAIKAQAEGVAKVQLRRFEQAMVAGRRWTQDEFELLYVNQPLMRQLASRVVWGVFESVAGEGAAEARAASLRGRPERLHQLVRLSPEGELTTADDEPWDWPEGAAVDADADEQTGDEAVADSETRWHIGIAHPLEMPEAEVAAFAQLLADYELMQSIEQLARPVTRSPLGATEAALTAAREAEVAALTAPGNASGPRRLLGLKSRGWDLSTEDGYMYHGASRELPDGTLAVVRISPGLPLYDMSQAPRQTITALQLHQRSGSASWGRLDAISHSELMRDMAYLAQL